MLYSTEYKAKYTTYKQKQTKVIDLREHAATES